MRHWLCASASAGKGSAICAWSRAWNRSGRRLAANQPRRKQECRADDDDGDGGGDDHNEHDEGDDLSL